MYKNQLQELAQRSCFNLPAYFSTREGPDHAPRFRASVTFNGEMFVGPSHCTTLRQAEHAAAEVALSHLSSRGPARSLTAKVLDETGVYKNLLQETAHRAGLKLPVYTTIRSGPGHSPVFSSTVELAGLSFNGEPAKTKKQSEKNAAMSAWAALKQMPDLGSTQHVKEVQSTNEEQDQVVVAKILSSFKPKLDDKLPLRQRSNLGFSNPRLMYYSRPKNQPSVMNLKPKLGHENERRIPSTQFNQSSQQTQNFTNKFDSWDLDLNRNTQKVNTNMKPQLDENDRTNSISTQDPQLSRQNQTNYTNKFDYWSPNFNQNSEKVTRNLKPQWVENERTSSISTQDPQLSRQIQSFTSKFDSWTRNFNQNSQKVDMNLNLGAIQVPSVICRSAFNAQAIKAAPMVHIRSVVPVFAARPAPTVKKEETEVCSSSLISKP